MVAPICHCAWLSTGAAPVIRTTSRSPLSANLGVRYLCLDRACDSSPADFIKPWRCAGILSLPPLRPSFSMPRTLIVCCDGTGNYYNKEITNVVKLFAALDKSDPETQLCYYQPGIGEHSNSRYSAILHETHCHG